MRRRARGVTLIEGLISTVILLTGLVGVFQGILVASSQNSMANRRTRATFMAAELASSLELVGRERLFGPGGLFTAAHCTAGYPSTLDKFRGDFTGVPANMAALTVCYIDFDTVALLPDFNKLTPAYTEADGQIFKRVLAIYTDPAQADVTYIGINVGWREMGGGRVVERFSAFYNTNINQTNLEF